MLVTIFIKLTGVLLAFLFFKPKIIGKKNLKHKGKLIIVSNHTSNYDPILMYMLFLFRRIYPLTAEILFTYNPVFSWMLHQLGCFSVDRKNGDTKALHFMDEKLTKGKAILILPEGKRSKKITTFKNGAVTAAMRNDCYILPIYVDGNYGIFKRVKVVVGEKIDFFSNKGDDYGRIEIVENTKILQEKVTELKTRLQK